MIEANYSQIPISPEGSSRKKLLLIGLVVFFVLLLIGLVVFFVQKKNTKTGSNNTSQNTENVSSTSSLDTVSSTVVVDPFPNDKDRDGVDDQKEKELGLSNRDFDSDGDGLSDADELDVWKTDPKKTDSDADGYSDGYEVFKGYNPNGSGKLTTP
jgi:hypothetical protein